MEGNYVDDRGPPLAGWLAKAVMTVTQLNAITDGFFIGRLNTEDRDGTHVGQFLGPFF